MKKHTTIVNAIYNSAIVSEMVLTIWLQQLTVTFCKNMLISVVLCLKKNDFDTVWIFHVICGLKKLSVNNIIYTWFSDIC